mmetsp:Transcript_85813/g.246293  ORF Transcript_85813/g.246293 Transcript_85813/m.246293 type:complete len:254 (+) Transcript_85813:164-925(+)
MPILAAAALVVLLLGGWVEATSLSLRTGGAVKAATYTWNSLCVERNCINPVFPAMHEFGNNILTENSNRTWSCAVKRTAADSAQFCHRVVAGYHFSVPQDVDLDGTEEAVVREQDRRALRAYVAHVTGLGRDFWRLTEPWNHDDCIQEVWRMACWTHFPRCNRIVEGQYLRPCASTCSNYIKACQVSCCDESVQCVFNRREEMADGTLRDEDGYADHTSPSPLCTGSALGLRGPLWWMALLLLLPGAGLLVRE